MVTSFSEIVTSARFTDVAVFTMSRSESIDWDFLERCASTLIRRHGIDRAGAGQLASMYTDGKCASVNEAVKAGDGENLLGWLLGLEAASKANGFTIMELAKDEKENS